MYPKRYRLKSRGVFHAVLNQRKGKKIFACPLFMILGLTKLKPAQKDTPQDAATTTLPVQFGIVISRKVHKRAVVRNKIKRRIKAILHQEVLPAVENRFDAYRAIVIIVRNEAPEASYQDIQSQLHRAFDITAHKTPVSSCNKSNINGDPPRD